MKQLRCSSCYKIKSAINFECIYEEGQLCRTCCKKIVPHSYDERMLNRAEKASLNSLYINNKIMDDVVVYKDTTWREKASYMNKT